MAIAVEGWKTLKCRNSRRLEKNIIVLLWQCKRGSKIKLLEEVFSCADINAHKVFVRSRKLKHIDTPLKTKI